MIYYRQKSKMFIHFLKFRMPNEFVELIKAFQNKIDSMGVTVSASWSENYSKSLILFEGQSKGNAEKIKNLFDVNTLLNGFVEKYCNVKPEIYIKDIYINSNNKGKKTIYVVFQSSLINEMKMDLMDSFGYLFNSENGLILKKFKNTDQSDNLIIENIDIELPIIHETYIKKSINIYDIYLNLKNVFYSSNIWKDTIIPESIVFETENKKIKKIILW